MKTQFPIKISLIIKDVTLIGVMVWLLGCSVTSSNPTHSITNLPSIWTYPPMPTQTPIIENTLTSISPTFDASIFNTLPKTGFDRSDAILITVSPGESQIRNVSIVNINGTSLDCITCNISLALEEQGYTAPKFLYPAWSPDGTMYAFVFLSDQKNSILIRGKTMDEVELISSVDSWLADVTWSPDGKYIAFTTGPTRGSGFGVNSVCYMEVNLSHPEIAEKQCISPEKANRYPSWSSDGKRIIFSGGYPIFSPGKPMDLYLWNLEDQSVTQFTDTPESEIVPQWSLDGSRLAYVLIRKNDDIKKYELWVLNADGTGKIRIGGEEDIYDLDWSPDGKRIAFTQLSPIINEGCDIGCLPFMILKILDIENGAISSLTDGTFWVGDPSWKP